VGSKGKVGASCTRARPFFFTCTALASGSMALDTKSWPTVVAPPHAKPGAHAPVPPTHLHAVGQPVDGLGGKELAHRGRPAHAKLGARAHGKPQRYRRLARRHHVAHHACGAAADWGCKGRVGGRGNGGRKAQAEGGDECKWQRLGVFRVHAAAGG